MFPPNPQTSVGSHSRDAKRRNRIETGRSFCGRDAILVILLARLAVDAVGKGNCEHPVAGE